MVNLKTFENWKGDYTHKINDIIDECMLPLETLNFKKVDINPIPYKDNFKFICKYERDKKLRGLVQLNGYIENGKIHYNQLNDVQYFFEEDREFVENEFMSVIEQISSIIKDELNDNQLNFSYTNYYKKEKILIFIPEENNGLKKGWM